MTLEKSKPMLQASAKSVQGLLYALETESLKDAHAGYKTACDGTNSYLQRVQKLRQDVLAKSHGTLNATGLKNVLKARLAEITLRQTLDNVKRLFQTSLKTAAEIDERKNKMDRRIRLILDDIEDSQKQGTTAPSESESVWQACAAPGSLALALVAEVEGSSAAKSLSSRELEENFATVNRAWDGQKSAITRQLSALGKIKFLQKLFRVLSAVILPLVSFAVSLLAPTGFLIATVLKTAAEVFLQTAAWSTTKPALRAAEDGKARESIESSAVQNSLAHAQKDVAQEAKRENRRDGIEAALENALHESSS